MSRLAASTWHEERYAAGERLATAARSLLALLPDDLMLTPRARLTLSEAGRALAEYDRTRDHP